MLEVVGAKSKVVDGRLQVQIDLQTKGDLPGHPFRGNQWTGGGEAVGRGDNRMITVARSENDVSENIRSQKNRVGDLIEKENLRDAIHKYTGGIRGDGIGYFRKLNRDLRSGGELDPELEKLATDLDKLTSLKFDPPGATAYRGIADPEGSSATDFLRKAEAALSEGGTIRDPGFGSASASAGVSRDFAGRSDSGDKVIMQIDGIERGAYLEGATKVSGELEVLLPRGTEYRIVGIDKGVLLDTERRTHTIVRVRPV